MGDPKQAIRLSSRTDWSKVQPEDANEHRFRGLDRVITHVSHRGYEAPIRRAADGTWGFRWTFRETSATSDVLEIGGAKDVFSLQPLFCHAVDMEFPPDSKVEAN